MTLTAENIEESPLDNKQAMMSCLNTMIWFNKAAARLLDAPCKITFSNDNGPWVIIKSTDGFEISNNKDRFHITKKARKLSLNLEKIFDRHQPKFEIKSTIDKNIFELKLL